MDTSGSILLTLIEHVRYLLEMPEVDAKYSNSFIVNHAMMPALVDTWSRILNQSSCTPLLRKDISLVVDQEHYVLPPSIFAIRRVTVWDSDDGIITDDAFPRDAMHPFGEGWSVTGNTLTVRPFPAVAQTVTIWYEPNGDILPHYSGTTNYGSLDATRTIMTLSSSPELGQKDRREDAYSGMILRVFDTGSGPIEERVIDTSDASAGTVTAFSAFTSDIATGSLAYEIFPFWANQSVIEAVACRTAMKLGVGLKITKNHRESILQEYRMALKTVQDNMRSMQGRIPSHFVTQTIDNPEFMARRVN